MLLEVLMQYSCIISHKLSPPKQRLCDIQVVIITNFVVVASISVKRIDFIVIHHYENTPIQIYGKFHLQKTENFQIKNSDIFYISVQYIDSGYSLEPPRRGSSNEYP